MNHHTWVLHWPLLYMSYYTCMSHMDTTQEALYTPWNIQIKQKSRSNNSHSRSDNSCDWEALTVIFYLISMDTISRSHTISEIFVLKLLKVRPWLLHDPYESSKAKKLLESSCMQVFLSDLHFQHLPISRTVIKIHDRTTKFSAFDFVP